MLIADWKTTPIRRIAVRETRVSRHYGVQLKLSLKHPVRHNTIVLRGLRGTFNWAPIMSRTGSLSDSEYNFFQRCSLPVAHSWAQRKKIPEPFITNRIWSCWQFSFEIKRNMIVQIIVPFLSNIIKFCLTEKNQKEHCQHIRIKLTKNLFLFTQTKLFGILLIQTEIRMYLPFSDWFGSKRTSVWIQIIRKMVNRIWFRVDLIRFQK